MVAKNRIYSSTLSYKGKVPIRNLKIFLHLKNCPEGINREETVHTLHQKCKEGDGRMKEALRQMQWRVVWLFCTALAVCCLLMLRLYSLSMNGALQQAAQQQSVYTLELGSTRGRIYDRNLSPLTDTEQHNVITVLPTADAVRACAEQISGPQRRAALDSAAQGKPFALDLEDGEKVYAMDVENFTVAARLPHNPRQQLAVHLLGYQNGDGTGVCGLEGAYDQELAAAGETVQVRYQVNAVGESVEGTGAQIQGSSRPPQKGLVLTLDRRMQKIVQQVGTEQIDRGAIVVMDVDSGAITASASFPQYDPYHLEEALHAPDSPMLNRALMPYCVGSSFKLAVAAAALESGISPDFSVDCVGGITVRQRIFYCHNRAGHRQTDLQRAIEHSCNPYFIRLGQKVGAEKILGMAKALGFGQETSLAPGITALAGTLPQRSDLSNLYELANFSFGQGKLTATPVQVAAMVSAIANGGRAVVPYLVEGSTQDGRTVEPIVRTAPVQVFSERTASILKNGMIGVVEEGSATMAKPKSGGAGGKTASAQTGSYDEQGEEIVHAWFAGFFPAQSPRYAVVVLIEGGEYGGSVASPLFRQIADLYGPVTE